MDRLYIVRWFDDPRLEDYGALNAEVFALRARLGAPLHCISLSCEPPEPMSADERRMMVSDAKRLLPQLDSMSVVMEGHGVKPSLMRTAGP